MCKVILYIAMSLDGYIADRDGGVAWLDGDGSDCGHPGSYPDFIQTVDTVVLGYRTYHQIISELSPENWVYRGLKSYVFTHRKLLSTEEILFTDSVYRPIPRGSGCRTEGSGQGLQRHTGKFPGGICGLCAEVPPGDRMVQ